MIRFVGVLEERDGEVFFEIQEFDDSEATELERMVMTEDISSLADSMTDTDGNGMLLW
jgi:hypothetical protein